MANLDTALAEKDHKDHQVDLLCEEIKDFRRDGAVSTDVTETKARLADTQVLSEQPASELEISESEELAIASSIVPEYEIQVDNLLKDLTDSNEQAMVMTNSNDVKLFRKVHAHNTLSGSICPRYAIDLSTKISISVIDRFIDLYDKRDPSNLDFDVTINKNFTAEEMDILDAFHISITRRFVELGTASEASDLPSFMNTITEKEYNDIIGIPPPLRQKMLLSGQVRRDEIADKYCLKKATHDEVKEMLEHGTFQISEAKYFD